MPTQRISSTLDMDDTLLMLAESNNFSNTGMDLGLDEFSPCVKLNPITTFHAIAVVFCIISIFALVGNGVVVTVMLMTKYVKSPTDIYILNLSFADILFAFTLPFWAAYIINGWIFGEFMCKAISVLQEINFYSGILLLVCISVDRYLAIVCATQYRRTKCYRVKYICFAVWTLAFALSLPVLMSRTVFALRDTNELVCYEHGYKWKSNWNSIIRIIHHCVGFIVPLISMLFCYGFTMKTLFRTRNHKKYKAMKIIIAVVMGFLICWLPYNITVFSDSLVRATLITDSCKVRMHLDRALFATQSLGFLHCCINPILYAFLGEKFKQSLFKLLYNKGLVSQQTAAKYGKYQRESGTERESAYSSSM